MRDAKGRFQRKLIDLFGSAFESRTERERTFVRLRTPLCGREQLTRALFVNEMRASFRTYSPGRYNDDG